MYVNASVNGFREEFFKQDQSDRPHPRERTNSGRYKINMVDDNGGRIKHKR